MSDLVIDAKELNANTAAIKKAIACENVSVWSDKNAVYIGGSSEGSTLILAAQLKIPSKVKFSIPLAILMGVTKGRTTPFTFSLEGNIIKYRSGRHSGRLSSVPFCPFDTSEKVKGIHITREQQATINDAMALRINAIWDSNPVMVGVNIVPESTTVVFFDAQHVACKKVAGKNAEKLDFTLPADTFTSITAVAGKKPYSLSITDSSIRAWSKSFDLTLPLTQISKANSTKDALALIDSLKQDVSIVLSGIDLETAIESAVALYEPKAVLDLVSKDKSLNLQMKSSAGTIRSALPCTIKGKAECKVDVFLLRDILPKRRSKLRINLHNNRVLWIRRSEKGVIDTVCTSLAS